MNAGHLWPLNLAYRSNSLVQVKLWDEDAPDPNDLLGRVLIDGTAQQHASATFARDEAHYELGYAVRDLPVVGNPIDAAISRLREFACARLVAAPVQG